MKKNLILTGMMGVGKSTVGKAVADKLSVKFIDVDKIIEKKESLSVSAIFEKKGENYFRNLEEKVTIEELKKNDRIISLGGGAFINSKIRQLIIKECVSFWLDLHPLLIEKRVKNSKRRPLLKNNNLRETLEKIYYERKEIYNLANFKIDCNKIGLDLIVSKIINFYVNFKD